LVEQGRIDEIIQAKPIELRAMVEEAAGLSLFKGRREISERKLERVRENLARVDDVLSEIERQLNFARRQAKKAEAYKIIRTELGELEQLAAARRIFEQREELASQLLREAELTQRASAASAGVEAAQQAADALGGSLTSLRERLANVERDLTSLRSAFGERARTRAFFERRLESLRELAPTHAARLLQLEIESTAARAARAFAGARLAREQRGDDGVGEARLIALRTTHREAEAALRQAERRVESLKDDLAELMREAAVSRGRLADLAGRGRRGTVAEARHRRGARRLCPGPRLSRRRLRRQHAAPQLFPPRRSDDRRRYRSPRQALARRLPDAPTALGGEAFEKVAVVSVLGVLAHALIEHMRVFSYSDAPALGLDAIENDGRRLSRACRRVLEKAPRPLGPSRLKVVV
jgi:chromosome segregation protein